MDRGVVHRMLAPVLLMCVLGDLPPEPSVNPAAEAPIERRHAIWAQPVLTAYFLGRMGGPYRGFMEAPVPYALGGQLALTPSISVSVEWSYVYASTSNDSISSPGWVMTGSLGLILPIWGPAQLKGFFLQPRIAFGGGRAWGPSCGFNCGVIGTLPLLEGMAILDAGFQWHFRRFFVALVVGVGAGVCVGCSANNAFLTVTDGLKGNRSYAGFAWGLDLNVLRIGVAL